MKTLFSFFLFLLTLSACTVEQSPEARERDDTDRTFLRLAAAAGIYNGYLINSDTEVVPLSLEVLVTKNPTSSGDKPVITAGLRLGLFGGIKVASTSAIYDWGVSELILSFAKKSPHSQKEENSPTGGLELKGYIQDGKFTQGTLVGARVGKRDLMLVKSGPSFFDDASSSNLTFGMNWAASISEPPLKGLMKVKTKSQTVQAPDTTDLSYLPGLEVSLEIEPFSVTPQNSQVAYYDPIAGTLETKLTDSTWLKTSGIFQSPSGKISSPKATLIQGGVLLRELNLQVLDTPVALEKLPFQTYLGTYQGTNDALQLKAIGYLSYLGSAGQNETDLPFPVFPKMRMEIDICNGDQVFTQMVMKLKALDYLGHKASFDREGNGQDPLELTFENDWSYLTGNFLQTDPHEGGGQPKVLFKPNASVKKLGCSAE